MSNDPYINDPYTFDNLLARMQHMHKVKDADYAGTTPYANFASARLFGMEPSRAVFVRISDKFHRMCSLLIRESTSGDGPFVKDESLEDTALDMANYLLIFMLLRQSEKE